MSNKTLERSRARSYFLEQRNMRDAAGKELQSQIETLESVDAGEAVIKAVVDQFDERWNLEALYDKAYWNVRDLGYTRWEDGSPIDAESFRAAAQTELDKARNAAQEIAAKYGDKIGKINRQINQLRDALQTEIETSDYADNLGLDANPVRVKAIRNRSRSSSDRWGRAVDCLPESILKRWPLQDGGMWAKVYHSSGEITKVEVYSEDGDMLGSGDSPNKALNSFQNSGTKRSAPEQFQLDELLSEYEEDAIEE